ncbi:transposase [Bifidobacterium bifidum]|uniref:transposase n=1 Tax=Bifidobacterium bifidum TaxID=1681 RepID=UPI0022E0E277|nr:transposase [Bifidobacterium bifidum]
MKLTKEQIKERNRKISAATSATKARRRNQEMRFIRCKIDKRKLTAEQINAINEIFFEATLLYDDCVTSQASVFEYVIPREVTYTDKNGNQITHPLTRIGAQMKQGIIRGIKAKVYGLATLKRSGHKVGHLKPKRRINGIPLQQPENTFKLRRNYITISKIPGPMHLLGVKQLTGWETGKAQLVRFNGDLFVTFYVFTDKDVYAREHARKSKPPIAVGGIDAGIKNEITESDGTKTTNRLPDSGKLRYWHRRLSKRTKYSGGWYRALTQIHKEYHRQLCSRKGIAYRMRDYLLGKYQRLYVQDEQINRWAKRCGKAIHSGALGLLYQLLKTEKNVTVLDKWQPTTRWCYLCGRRTPQPPAKRVFRCAYCGYSEDRDVHAAKNMVHLGRSPLSHEQLRMANCEPIGPYAA